MWLEIAPLLDIYKCLVKSDHKAWRLYIHKIYAEENIPYSMTRTTSDVSYIYIIGTSSNGYTVITYMKKENLNYNIHIYIYIYNNFTRLNIYN